MRAALLSSSVILLLALGADPAAAQPHVIHVAPSATDTQDAAPPSGFERYRGYAFDLSESAGRKDAAALADNLRRQLDIVESVGFSPRVLRFFHSVPIVASELSCLEQGAGAACYGPVTPNRTRLIAREVTSWDHDKQQWVNPDVVDLAVDSGIGVIMLRPNMMTYAQDPVMLHEFLHAYHARLMPGGYENPGVRGFYAYAKSKDLLPKDTYALKNPMEFFAVTASIFLAGKESVHEPKTREKLKEKMPDYYKYLVEVFGFDPAAPDAAPPAAPVASAQ